MKRLLVTPLILWLFALPALAGTDDAPALRAEIPETDMPEITTVLAPAQAAIGDPIVWRVEAVRKPDDRLVLPAALNFGKLEIAAKNETEEAASNGRVRQRIEVVLVAFDTGESVVPPQKITVVDRTGNISEVVTPEFSIQINSVIANAPEPALKSDEGPGEIVLEDDYTLLFIAGAIAAAALIALLTLLIRRLWAMRRPRPAPPPPPPRPAEEIALEKLKSLACSHYLEEGQHKTYHLTLSETFREYLGNRYGFDALEMSTAELRHALRGCPVPVTTGVEITRLLEDTDLVKFARFVPAVKESEALLEQAVHIVHITTPSAAVTPSAPAAATESGGSHV
jgi:hypothetical protein